MNRNIFAKIGDCKLPKGMTQEMFQDELDYIPPDEEARQMIAQVQKELIYGAAYPNIDDSMEQVVLRICDIFYEHGVLTGMIGNELIDRQRKE